MREKQNIAITISRQVGSGGSYIGYLVAKELGFKYLDREILRQAAERLGTAEEVLELLEERSAGLIENIVRGFSFGTMEAAYMPPLIQPVYSRDLFTLECKIMHEITGEHGAVIVGRAGFYALRDRPGVIRVFIQAPKEIRIKRVMEVQKITNMQEVRSEIEKVDRRRARFIRDMAGVDWSDARNYHLCIDSNAIGFPASVEMIVRLANKEKFSNWGNNS